MYWGHRISVDLDFFCHQNVNLDLLDTHLTKIDQSKLDSKNPIGRMYTIQQVKCDFLNYPYPFQFPINYEEGIPPAQLDDVVALKLGALANRGAKKDIYDLYYILKFYSVERLVEIYKIKYNVTDAFPLLKSLTYFGDAEAQLPPLITKDKKLTWPEVKKFIVKKVDDYVR